MSGIIPRSTFGTPAYGPFRDNTVQTYFRFSPAHFSESSGYHYDLQLMKPTPVKDTVSTWYHIKLDR
jgi:hypothetical protein